MKRMISLIAALIVLSAMPAFAQAPKAGSLEGVWKVAEVVVTGANASTNSKPLPGLYIFTKKHYSQVLINGTQPRPKFDALKTPGKPTDAEKIARYEQWNPFAANSGTYEVKGTKLTRHPMVAKNEAVMTGPPIEQDIKMEGNAVWLIAKSAPGEPVSESRTKLVRLE